MSETDQENVRRYSPQHPLPEEIQKMERDETICQYCGVSYLIHSEIKALEKKLKLVEKELEHYKGCQERENKLKEELQILQDQKGEFEMTITVKDAAIATLTNSLKSQESISESLRNQKTETEKQLLHAEQSNKDLKERNNQLERHLPSMKMALTQQKIALEDIHSFMDKRDLQMKAELEILLQHVQATCANETKEKQAMESQMSELRARWDNTLQETEDLQSRLGKQEEQIRQLDKLFTENKNLKEKCTALENANKGLQKQFDEAIEKCRSLQMETQQFKEQFKTKTSEVEELTTTQRRKEQALEMTMLKLKSDLKQRDNALDGAKREVKELQNKLEQQMQHDADRSRQSAKATSETKNLKESFFRAKEEIENLKEEREAMITSHQNRIEQLRASFKEKLSEADSWQEKLEAAIQKEKERHARELQELETRLKESFVMELEIEKSKYRELMKKYQTGSQETEEKLRAQLQSIESRYKAEINDLNELLAESRRKSKEVEEELRREIASLKAIIKDLEARLARLDVGNEDLVMKLKSQLRETHQELEMTREILDKEKKNSDTFKEEVKHLQETVQKECEERFELTEALSATKEELLQLKKPVGSHSNATRESPSPCSPPSRMSVTRDSAGGYTSITPRQATNMSLPPTDDPIPNMAPRRSFSEPSPVISNSPVISKPHTYSGGVKKEYTLTNSNTMVFTGDAHFSQRQVGGSNKRTGGTLAENRRRIAAILGRK